MKRKLTQAQRKRRTAEQKLMLLKLKVSVRKVTMQYSISQYHLAQQALKAHERFMRRTK